MARTVCQLSLHLPDLIAMRYTPLGRGRSTFSLRRLSRYPIVERMESRLLPATLTVNTQADDTTADTTLSLREAIEVANGMLPLGSLSAEEQAQIQGTLGPSNTIGFSIAGERTVIQGNFIGIAADGSTPLGNGGDGVHLLAPNTTIGGTSSGAGNVISANGGDGIDDEDGGTVTVQGNSIDTDATGLVAAGNLADGIFAGPSGDTIGRTISGAGNVISANGQAGIELFGDAVVQGNKVGTSADGSFAIGNSGPGILIQGEDSLIGGTDADAGNLVSGNGGDGIVIKNGNNLLQGNRVGTTAAGTSALGNTGRGVLIAKGANTIGGSVSGAGNPVSGNHADGIELDSSDNVVQGNLVGINGEGSAALPNASAIAQGGAGLLVTGPHNLIGGDDRQSGNVISGNHGFVLDSKVARQRTTSSSGTSSGQTSLGQLPSRTPAPACGSTGQPTSSAPPLREM